VVHNHTSSSGRWVVGFCSTGAGTWQDRGDFDMSTTLRSNSNGIETPSYTSSPVFRPSNSFETNGIEVVLYTSSPVFRPLITAFRTCSDAWILPPGSASEGLTTVTWSYQPPMGQFSVCFPMAARKPSARVPAMLDIQWRGPQS
jgi:hypothetical protein